MNIDNLQHDPEWLEGARGLSRYRIDERDQNEEVGQSEWFCDDRGASGCLTP